MPSGRLAGRRRSAMLTARHRRRRLFRGRGSARCLCRHVPHASFQ